MGEVIDVMERIYGIAHHETMDALILLETGGLTTADADADLGIEAGRLHAKHYHRTSSPLSMADCVALATAVLLREAIATSDPPLAAAARAEGVTVLALPDSKGRRPEPPSDAAEGGVSVSTTGDSTVESNLPTRRNKPNRRDHRNG